MSRLHLQMFMVLPASSLHSLDALFAPPRTNGNGRRRLTPEPDQVIGALEHRQHRRFRVQTVIHVLAILVMGGGLWLIANAVDSGLEHLAGVMSVMPK